MKLAKQKIKLHNLTSGYQYRLIENEQRQRHS